MMMEVEDTSGLKTQIQSSKGLSLIYFWSDSHEACKKDGQVDQVLTVLNSKFKDQLNVFKVNAGSPKVIDAVQFYNVTSVPTFVLVKNSQKLQVIEGVKPTDLVKGIETLLANETNGTEPVTLEQRLKDLISRSPVMLFMKGTPEEPRCGFSNKIVQLLKRNAVPFQSFDILEDEEVRQGLKVFSNWPTYPQLYVKGSLVGGLDIVAEMANEGPLREQFGLESSEFGNLNQNDMSDEEKLNFRLKELVNSNPVMLFMKGSPDAPRCGFSNKMVSLLRKEGVEFGHFDILEDEDVRQGLKKYSNWPTYPQLYFNGELVGGLDVVKELQEEGELRSALGLEA